MTEPSAASDVAPVRVPYVAPCELRSADGKRAALVRNLSRDGVYLHLDEVPEGEVELRFPLPDGGSAVAVRAAVRWSKETGEASAGELPMGCGFRFADLTAADAERIERMVAEHEARPTPLAGVSQPRSGAARIPLIASCRLAGPSGEATGHTCNLSIFGVYAAVEPVPAEGESVELRLVLPGDSEPFVHRATVTWRNLEAQSKPHLLPVGCGLRFDDLALPDIRVLAQIVDGYLARLPKPEA